MGSMFGNWFNKQCDVAARLLAEVGCTDREIMSITGHKTAKDVTLYTNAADQVALSDQAMIKIGGTKTE